MDMKQEQMIGCYLALVWPQKVSLVQSLRTGVLSHPNVAAL